MNFSKFFSLPKSIQLLPFLFFYVLLILLWKLPSETAGDEGRYLNFAHNLLNGFYSPPMPNINLWNGPGFPILLTPFLYFNIKLLYIRLINAILLYFSLVLTYKTSSYYFENKTAFIIAAVTGLYFPSFQMLRFIHTETLTWFIFSLIIFLSVKDFSKNKYYIGLILGCLCLIKVIFFYVIISGLTISVLGYFLSYQKSTFSNFTKLLSLSLLVILPYLLYTYNLTKKPLYVTNSGGLSLYTISTTDENEYGDWDISTKFNELKEHKKINYEVSSLNPIQKDSLYKVRGVENIKNEPIKFVKNWACNVSRMFCEYPYSYVPFSPKLFVYIIPGFITFAMIIYTLFLFLKNIHIMDKKMIPLLIFFIIYLVLSSALSAYGRMFYITIPFWCFFIVKTHSEISKKQ